MLAILSAETAPQTEARDLPLRGVVVLTMPLFFASNAIYPLELMPSWLRTVSRVNPLTYLVDALRRFIVAGSGSQFGIGTDFLVLAAVLVGLTLVAARLYPSVVR